MQMWLMIIYTDLTFVFPALGGNVGPNPTGKFIFKKENINPLPSFLKLQFVADAAAKYPLASHSLVAAEMHRDCVVSLPKNAVLLASSETCVHEVFMIGNHILATQGHLEFTSKDIPEKLMPLLLESSSTGANAHAESVEELEAKAQSLESFEQDYALFVEIVKNFLNGDRQKEDETTNDENNNNGAVSSAGSVLDTDSTIDTESDAVSSGSSDGSSSGSESD